MGDERERGEVESDASCALFVEPNAEQREWTYFTAYLGLALNKYARNNYAVPGQSSGGRGYAGSRVEEQMDDGTDLSKTALIFNMRIPAELTPSGRFTSTAIGNPFLMELYNHKAKFTKVRLTHSDQCLIHQAVFTPACIKPYPTQISHKQQCRTWQWQL
jgi:hypothetical protein